MKNRIVERSYITNYKNMGKGGDIQSVGRGGFAYAYLTKQADSRSTPVGLSAIIEFFPETYLIS